MSEKDIQIVYFVYNNKSYRVEIKGDMEAFKILPDSDKIDVIEDAINQIDEDKDKIEPIKVKLKIK